MSTQIDEDVKNIQELFSQKKFEAVYEQYAPVLENMLFVHSLEEWKHCLEYVDRLEIKALRLYLSAWRGECLLLGGYHGEATREVLDFFREKIPAELWEKLNALGTPIVLDIDDPKGTLKKQLSPYQKLLVSEGFVFHIDFEDTYCAGAYFLSVEKQ